MGRRVLGVAAPAGEGDQVLVVQVEVVAGLQRKADPLNTGAQLDRRHLDESDVVIGLKRIRIKD